MSENKITPLGRMDQLEMPGIRDPGQIAPIARGSPNKMGHDLMSLVMRAAENVGFVKKDKKTGEWVATGKGGTLAYLEWAAVHRADRFIALMARVAPKHVIASVTHKIMTREETDAEMKDLGLPVELLEHLQAGPEELDLDEDDDPYGLMKDVTPDDTGK